MTTGLELNPLLLGHDETGGIVALEYEKRQEGDEVVLFIRDGSRTKTTRVAFRPFMWLTDGKLLCSDDPKPEVKELKGKGILHDLAEFHCWKDLEKAAGYLRKKTGRTRTAPDAPYFYLNDPIQQYLLATGRTSFKRMKFGDLKRLQVDIETYTGEGYDFPNAQREGDRIIAIALADETGWTEVLSGAELGEKELLQEFVKLVGEKDPDVIEGHNFFKFDLPYISARAKRHKVKLTLGRDGSTPRVRSGRFTVAERSVAYPRAEMYGRHVIDTLFMVQIYDVSDRSLESFRLKDVAVHFDIAAPERTYVDPSEIPEIFDKDPKRLMSYARDDILETRALSDLLSPIYFAQAQMLPLGYQNICVRGNAVKIDSLLLREYYRQGYGIAMPDPARQFAGGYTDIFFEGVARNVHHCDIRSLYPSLMLKDGLAPETDDLGVFLELLDYLRDFRLKTKEKIRSAKGAGEDSTYLRALDSTFKVLINSFYGYLGFSQARFGDFDKAEKVAAGGRELLRKMIRWIEKHDGKPIEIDTDGIYFVPPAFKSALELEAFRKEFQASLPEGIEVEFDGEYDSMYSYKMKNYALLDQHGEIVIKGAALKSRGLEPFQRDFLREMLKLKLTEKDERIAALRDKYGKAILHGSWPIKKLAKTETLQDAPATYAAKIRDKARGRNAAYELALQSDRGYQAGDQISYYVTGSKKSVAVHASAKLVSEWDPDNRDENIAYYVAKLAALYKKFVD